jgi:hypothetical protein
MDLSFLRHRGTTMPVTKVVQRYYEASSMSEAVLLRDPLGNVGVDIVNTKRQ